MKERKTGGEATTFGIDIGKQAFMLSGWMQTAGR